MPTPTITLGVPIMDEDHANLEALLDRAGKVDDADLAPLLEVIEAETRDHFLREEELMRACHVPVLSCHIEQHRLFLSEFGRGHELVTRHDAPALRQFLVSDLPRLLTEHVNTVDRVTATFLLSDPASGAAVHQRSLSSG